jgi:hypothetical protein
MSLGGATGLFQRPAPFGLTEVVIRASGAGDGAQVNAVIQAATGPTRLLFPDAAYQIDEQIVVDKDNIFFVGASSATNPDSSGRTTFTVTDTWSGPVLLWSRSGGTTSEYSVSGGGLSGIYVYGANIADDGIGIKMARNLSFHDFSVQSCAGSALQLTTNGTTGQYDDVSNCRFRDFQLIQSDAVGLEIVGGYGCSFTGFSLTILGTTGTGISIIDADDMYFDEFAVYVASGCVSVDLPGEDYGSGAAANACVWGKGFFNGYPVIKTTSAGFDLVARGNLFLGLSTIDVVTTWNVAPGAAPSYLDTDGRHNLRQHGKTTSLVQDDFIAGSLTSGDIGELGWTLPSGTLAYGAGVASHPGVVRLSTGSTITTLAALVLRPSTTGLVLPADSFDMEFVLALHTMDTDTSIRFGLLDGYSGFNPTQGIWFEKAGAATAWYVACKDGSGTTGSTALAAPVADTYQRFRIRRINSTTIGFTIGDLANGASDYTITANVPTKALTPMLLLLNTAAADKSVDIDWFQLHITGMSR